MTKFQPAGDVARWRAMYALIQTKPTGSIVTYDELGKAVGIDSTQDRQAVQMAARRAIKESLEQDNRALDSVPNVGYRIVQAEEHLRLAKDHQRKSKKALQRAHSNATHVDFNEMQPDVRKAFEVVGQALAMQMDFMRRTDIRQKRVEQALETVKDQSARSAEEIEALRGRLARVEQRLGGAQS